jgi:uncharacterized membrane protein YedE/YeeE
MHHSYPHSLLGGALIGLSAAILLLLNGRIAGVSGIVSGAIGRFDDERLSHLLFLAGLVGGPLLYLAGFGAWPIVHVATTSGLMIIAGMLVGFGTRLGSGCTSGHGVCGLARLSSRSLTAVAVFLCTGMLTVLVMGKLGIV